MNQATLAKVEAMQWPVLEPADSQSQRRPVALNKSVCVAGARADMNLPLGSSLVSRAHALFVTDGPIVYVRDLASRNHVYVNERPVREAVLDIGDIVRMGPVAYRCRSGFYRPAKRDLTRAPLELRSNDTGRFSLDGRTAVIGNRQGCDIRIDQADVDVVHAVVFGREGKWFVRDLRSRTGTFVNGVAVEEVELNVGDALRIGGTELHCDTPLDESAKDEEPTAANDQEPVQTAATEDLTVIEERAVSDDESPALEWIAPNPRSELPAESSPSERAQDLEFQAEELKTEDLEEAAAQQEQAEQLRAEELEDLENEEPGAVLFDAREAERLSAEPLIQKPPGNETSWSTVLPESPADMPVSEEAISHHRMNDFSPASAPHDERHSTPLELDEWKPALQPANAVNVETAALRPHLARFDQEEAELAFADRLHKLVDEVKQLQYAWEELVAKRVNDAHESHSGIEKD